MFSKFIRHQCSSRARVLTSSYVTTPFGTTVNPCNTVLTNSSSRNKLLFSLASQPLPIYPHSSLFNPITSTCGYGSRGFSSTSENVDSSEEKEAVEAEPVNPDEAVPPVSDDSAKIEKLEKEVKDMKDKVLRALAEEENVRRIAKRDIENAKVYGLLLLSFNTIHIDKTIFVLLVRQFQAYANEKFAKALLEVADNLDYAIAAASEDGNKDKADPMDNRTGADSATMLKNLVEGVEATNKGLLKAFAQFGVIKYGAVGDKFDPTIHDALFQVPDDSMEPNTIAQLLQPGYKMKDRVLRAAQVGTSKKTE